MAELNYIGPIHSVDVESKSGKRIKFRAWAESYNVGEVSDLRQERVFPYLTQTSVKLSGGGPDAARGMNSTGHEMSWSIEMPYDSWIVMVDGYEECFTSDAKCAIQLGYSGPNGEQLTERFEGIISSPSLSLSSDFVNMSFTAVATTWHMGTWDGALAMNESVLKSIRLLADSHATKIYYLNQENKEAPVPNPAPDVLGNLNRIVNEVKQGSDFQMIKELIEINAGYEFYRRNDRIVIYSQKERAAAPIPIFTFRGHTDPKRNRHPILTISNQDTQRALNPAARLLRMADVDLDSKITSVLEIRNEDLDIDWQRQHAFSDVVGSSLAGLSFEAAIKAREDLLSIVDGATNLPSFQPKNLLSESVFAAKDISGESISADKGSFRLDNAGKLLPVASNDPSGKEKALMHKRKAVANSGIQCEWTTPGNPSLRPGMEVIIQGCSHIFDGRYQLHSVAHEVGGDGFTTTLSGVVYGGSDKVNDASEKVPYNPGPLAAATIDANKLSTELGALDAFDSKIPEEPDGFLFGDENDGFVFGEGDT